MSDIFRQSVNGAPSKPRPNPILLSTPENDEQPLSSDSSSSSADSAASANTLRPSAKETNVSAAHWSNYFAQELFLEQSTNDQHARYHVYLTSPSNPQKDPLFICHHGAGSSALSFALLAKHIRSLLPTAGILSLEARAHGSIITSPSTNETIEDFSIETLASDALTMIQLTQSHQSWPHLPPLILVGHSLGGAVVTHLAASTALGNSLVGFAVIDVVEGSALEALGYMKTYLSSRPSNFASAEEAVDWHVRSRTIRSRESAEISTPSLLIPTSTPAGGYTWKTDLESTTQFWWSWFTGLSAKFLAGRGAKMLILAGTDRLDKDLMIGQMQGKFQLVVVPEAGHFVQEDVPEKTAELLVEFWRRNDRGALVLPMKVDEMIRQGKKV